jgi:hypothetical protein
MKALSVIFIHSISTALAVAILFGSCSEALAGEAEVTPGSPFRVDPAMDMTITGITAASALTLYFYGESVTRTRYSVPSGSGVNRLDRSVIGNDSDAFRLAGDIGSVAVPAAAAGQREQGS